MSETLPLFLAHLVGFAGFLWLGLYVLIHGDRGRVATLMGVTALATGLFFMQGGVLSVLRGEAATHTFQRAMWWTNVVPIALWLHLSLWLNPRATRAPWRRSVLGASYGIGALLTAAGMTTDVVLNYRHTIVTPGPGWAVYVVYLLACTAFAAVNLLGMGRSALPVPTGAIASNEDGEDARPMDVSALMAARGSGGSGNLMGTMGVVRGLDVEVRLLVIGAVLFLLGTTYLALKVLLSFSRYDLPGYLLLLAGLGAVGATVAVRSALLLGKDVRRDVVYSATGLVLLLAPSLVVTDLLVGFASVAHGVFALLLAALITAAHTLYDAGRGWLDAAFFTPGVREERAAARAYVTALATQPVAPHPDIATRKSFDDAVRRALTHLSDPTKLATTPLLTLAVVAQGIVDQSLEDNRLNRAAVLKEILLELLDGLRPQDGATGVTGDAWRFYNCLYYPYVRGIGRRRAPTVLRHLVERRRRDGEPRGDLEKVLEWLLQVDEDTFYKWQRRGSDTIAATLREREEALGGAVPAAPGTSLASWSGA